MSTDTIDAIRIENAPFGMPNVWIPGEPRVVNDLGLIMTMGEMTLNGETKPAVIVVSLYESAGVSCYHVHALHHMIDGGHVSIDLSRGRPSFLGYRSLAPIGVEAQTMTRDGAQRRGVTIDKLTLVIGERVYQPEDLETAFASLDERLALQRAAHAAAVADGTFRPENAVDLSLEYDAPVDGGSRLGGRPVIATDAAWPVDADGKALDFVATIDLAAIAPLAETGLPATGTLSLFYDLEEQPWGIEDREMRSLAIIHTVSGGVERDHASGTAILDPVALSMKGVVTAPTAEDHVDIDADLLTIRAWLAGSATISEDAGGKIADTLEACGRRTWRMSTRSEYQDDYGEHSYNPAGDDESAPDLNDIDAGDDAAMERAMDLAEAFKRDVEAGEHGPDLTGIDAGDDAAMERAIDMARSFQEDMASDLIISLGGEVDGIQGPMRQDMHEKSQRLHGEHASESPQDWVHLLTLREGGVFEFGDCGEVYVWIMARDLAAADFSRVMFNLQCM